MASELQFSVKRPDLGAVNLQHNVCLLPQVDLFVQMGTITLEGPNNCAEKQLSLLQKAELHKKLQSGYFLTEINTGGRLQNNTSIVLS